MKKAQLIVLVITLLVGFFWRFWQVEVIPSGLNRDEAALAYNGLLLQQAGKDEWQRSWPLNLESFGDYKLIGYPAVVSLLFRFLPVTDMTVRLPSVLAGSLLPLAIYFLAKRLGISATSAITASILAAITPVFFFFSRMAFEANVALLLFVLGVSVLFQPKYKSFDIIAMVVLFTLSVFTYNTPLLLLPFVILLIPFIHGVTKVKRWLLPVMLLTIVWMGAFFSLSQTFSQKSGITIFNDPLIVLEEYPAFREQFTGVSQTLLGNKYVFYSLLILKNSALTFSPHFLVIEGGAHPWHSLPGWAHLNWIEWSLLFIGLALIIATSISGITKNKMAGTVSLLTQRSWLKHPSLRKAMILYLTMVATIPAAITVDAPHATRSLFFFVMALVVGALAIDTFLQLLKSRPVIFKYLLLVAIIGFSLAHFWQYQTDYFYQYQTQSEKLFQSNFLQAVTLAEQKYPNQTIAVVDQGGYQYILLSWYKKLNADEFFSTVVKQNPNRIGFRYGEKVSHFHFVDKPEDRLENEKGYIIWNADTFEWQVKE